MGEWGNGGMGRGGCSGETVTKRLSRRPSKTGG